MKLKEFFYLLGMKPAPKTYGHEVKDFDLPHDGRVQYAQWLHPSDRPKSITQECITNLRKFIRPGDVSIDIGAHTGDTTVPLAIAAGPTGCVLALEPNPYVYAILKKNSELNTAKGRIVPLNFAATAEPGEFFFEYSDPGFCNGGLHQGISKWRHAHAFKVKVKGDHLPTYLQQHHPELVSKIRFIKTDAEGYDLEILKTLRDLLASHKPFVRTEVYRFLAPEKREALHDFYTALGYDVRLLESDVYDVGPSLKRTDMTAREHFDIFAVPQ